MERVDLSSLAIKLSRSENIGTLGPIVSKILKIAPDPTAGANALEDLLAAEPALTARVLKAANSPLYAFHTSASTVGAAVMVLGMKVVQSLVLSAAYKMTTSASSEARHFDRTSYWQHSLAAAIAARKLAILASRFDAEDFYTMGLLHDVGMLALESCCPKEWDRALVGSRAAKLPLHLVESNLISFSHRDAGVVLAERWGLDERQSQVIRHLHDPPFEHQFSFEIGCVSIADALAHQAGFVNQSPDIEVEVDALCLDAIGLDADKLEEVVASLPSEVATAEAAYNAA